MTNDVKCRACNDEAAEDVREELEHAKNREDGLLRACQSLHRAWLKTRKERDEAAKRFTKLMSLDTSVLAYAHEDDHSVTMRIKPGVVAAELLALSFRELLDDGAAENYVEVQFLDKPSGGYIAVTIQRPGRPTPHELRVAAEAERDAANARAERLLMRETDPENKSTEGS
jgi:hypothetical protein